LPGSRSPIDRRGRPLDAAAGLRDPRAARRQAHVEAGLVDRAHDPRGRSRAVRPVSLAVQAGRVLPILGYQWNLGVEPFYVVAHNGPSPEWGFRFGISLLLPE